MKREAGKESAKERKETRTRLDLGFGKEKFFLIILKPQVCSHPALGGVHFFFLLVANTHSTIHENIV